jgi:excisionase family DNA binding protein
MSLTPKQAADRTKVSVSLVYQWCAEGRLPHYRFGRDGRRGRILIDPADLEQFIAECRKERPALLAAE